MFLSKINEDGHHIIEFSEGALDSILAISIVFTILVLIIICINILKLFFKNKKVEVQEEVVSAPKQQVQKSTEIKDDDMMAAALVATIDYASETKEDVRLVSIKQIN